MIGAKTGRTVVRASGDFVAPLVRHARIPRAGCKRLPGPMEVSNRLTWRTESAIEVNGLDSSRTFVVPSGPTDPNIGTTVEIWVLSASESIAASRISDRPVGRSRLTLPDGLVSGSGSGNRLPSSASGTSSKRGFV